MKQKQLYEKYIQKLEAYLEENDFENIDIFLQHIYSIELNHETIILIDDILQEATLYLEFKEQEYKDQALKLIEDFKK